MNVLTIAPSLGVRGGISALLRNLLHTSLAEKYQILLIPSHVDGPRLLKFGVAIWGLWRMIFIVRMRGVDLVYIHGSDIVSASRKSFYYRVAEWAGIPVVYHFHGGYFDKRFLKAPAAVRAMVIRMLEGAARVVCVSETWKAKLEAIAPRARFEVVYNGVLIPNGVHQDNREKKDGCVITFLGSISESKGIFDLLAALTHLISKGIRVDLLVGGHGASDGFLKKAASLKYVRYMGWLDHDRKVSVFRNTDIFVLPSYFEGLPMSILEAMSYGIPVISTPVGGIPEAVENGKTGILVPPGNVEKLVDAISLLATNSALRHSMGTAARKRVREKFDINITAAQLDSLFSSLITQSQEETML